MGRGFAESDREAVAALYWEAFERKLRPAFADVATGFRAVRASLRPDRFLVARSGDGAVVGACGFHRSGAGAVDLTWRSLRARLSAGQALRAIVVLSLLAREPSSSTLVLDGICVESSRRGAGVGTLLLAATEALAREWGMRSVRLSVIEANSRARALYLRRGFAPIGEGSLGFLESIYGFDRYTTMCKEVVA